MEGFNVAVNNELPFSVLICVYEKDNDEYFEQALKSITIDQTLKPSQILLVVDGPINNEKRDIIERFSKLDGFTFDVLKLPVNVGQGKALNAGLDRCKYDYVARMDSDDISMPDRFERQIGYLKMHPEVDVMSSFVEEFDGFQLSKVRALPLTAKEIHRFGKLRSPINHGACIYKKEKVLAVGGYSSYVQLQDYLLFVKMICAGFTFSNTADIVLKVRMPGGYVKKSGLNYFKEEVNLAKDFYRMDYIGRVGIFRNILIRALPRLLPNALVDRLYNLFLR
ncbi:MAG: glycosyltransferase [Campylobacterales bacterium]|nr:glycosyltransferase [Campylobacterales bacterium]